MEIEKIKHYKVKRRGEKWYLREFEQGDLVNEEYLSTYNKKKALRKAKELVNSPYVIEVVKCGGVEVLRRYVDPPDLYCFSTEELVGLNED